MKEIIVWTEALIVISAISIVFSHPTSEEPSRDGKDVPPIMQTLLTDIAKQLISRSTASNQVRSLA